MFLSILLNQEEKPRGGHSAPNSPYLEDLPFCKRSPHQRNRWLNHVYSAIACGVLLPDKRHSLKLKEKQGSILTSKVAIWLKNKHFPQFSLKKNLKNCCWKSTKGCLPWGVASFNKEKEPYIISMFPYQLQPHGCSIQPQCFKPSLLRLSVALTKWKEIR